MTLEQYTFGMNETTRKTSLEVERNPDGTIKSGSLNPHGRPKGKTMKEYAREFYMNKTDEEKRAYIEWLDEQKPGFAWTMGEGNPHSTSDNKTELIVPLPILGNVQLNNGPIENNVAK